jgi:hypothetical protein
LCPDFAEDGGEEPEVAGVYLIDAHGAPRRIGFTVGNEFSDHVLERKNYLYLAASKLRTCAIGPELVVDENFDLVPGEVSIDRGEQVLWSREIRTGEAPCATAWRTSSTIISSSNSIGVPAICIFTSSARTRSASAMAFGWKTAT